MDVQMTSKTITKCWSNVERQYDVHVRSQLDGPNSGPSLDVEQMSRFGHGPTDPI